MLSTYTFQWKCAVAAVLLTLSTGVAQCVPVDGHSLACEVIETRSSIKIIRAVKVPPLSEYAAPTVEPTPEQQSVMDEELAEAERAERIRRLQLLKQQNDLLEQQLNQQNKPPVIANPKPSFTEIGRSLIPAIFGPGAYKVMPRRTTILQQGQPPIYIDGPPPIQDPQPIFVPQY